MAEILSKMKEEAEGTLGLLWKKVHPEDLKPGDHIYCHKRHGTYSHHGIYVGDRSVIHFNPTEPKNHKAIIPLPKSQQSSDRPPCPVCLYDQKEHGGVVKTCLDCFRREKEKLHSIRRYVYRAPKVGHLLKKLGTCTMLESERSADEVIKAAEELLENSNDFGEYNLIRNNCEHFATYCKTGQKHCEQILLYSKAREWVKKPVG